MAKTNRDLAPTIRTSAGLRDALFDELDALRAGTTNPANANATAKLADQIINTVKMEVDVEKYLSHAGDRSRTINRQLGEPLSLGTPR